MENFNAGFPGKMRTVFTSKLKVGECLVRTSQNFIGAHLILGATFYSPVITWPNSY